VTVGDEWYAVAETLFLVSCAVQACAAIVETSQSLDGFIASFLIGKTYAMQFYPEVKMVEWSASACHQETEFELESGMEDCTPFHDAGSMIFTLGFFLTTILFLPLGRGHLKETIFVQLLSFGCLLVLLSKFSSEFIIRGFEDSPVKWWGSDVTQLAGVVLFNYAYSITVPSWLNEKAPDVSVNRTIWGATTLATVIYIGFGLMGAMTFDAVGPNLLVLLASSKVHFTTRICAALFGVTIIGCGVPVFCVIIKNAMLHNTGMGHNWALFW
jgi:hypothetical protein